ncbi:MAG: glycerophosphodiester phosphodiesterase family protein [bacterium]
MKSLKFLGILLVFCLIPNRILFAGESNAAERSSSITLPTRGICAHRGAMATHPENTLPAFQEAVRIGAHMIEFDVRLTRDGRLAILHDSTLDRTTDGTGKISEWTLADLKKLDAGIKKGDRFKDTRVPTLTETLAVMPDNIWLNVHLKGDEELGRKVAEVIVREKRQHQAFLACGSDAARAAHRIDPNIIFCNMDRQGDSMDYANVTIESGARFIQILGKGEFSPDVISKLKDHRVYINYYSADTPEILLKLFDAGVDFPLVNDPELMMKAAREIGIEPVIPIFRE